MKIGLVGGSAQQFSLPFDAQRTVNLYPILDKMGKEIASLFGTPGLLLFTNLGDAPMRALFLSSTGRSFGVCGSILYEIDAAGNKTASGNLKQSSGIVYIEENGFQLALCDGINLYIFTYATNIFQQIIGGLNYVTNGDFSVGTGWTLGAGWAIATGTANATTSSAALSQTSPILLVPGKSYTLQYTITRSAGTIQPSIGGANGIVRSAAGTYVETIIAGATQITAFTGVGFTGTVDNITINDQAFGLPAKVSTLTFLDSFFEISEGDSGRIFKSSPNDGTMWNALDFATAESSPDNVTRVIAAIGILWPLGVDTSEIWTNTGSSGFPFKKISGGKMTMGCLAPASALELDNTLFWIGRNKNGLGGVFRANGFIPKKISTEPIDLLIAAATDPSNIRAYSYEDGGHLFYVITGGGLATSPVYDVTTDIWHEKAFLNAQGAFEQHLGCCYMNAFGKHLVGDRTNGNIYIMDSKYYSDNGNPLKALRIYTHLSDEAKRIRYNSLVIGVESGVGLQSGQGSDPVIELRLSTDGARTWSDRFVEPIGKVGKYKNKAQFRRLGVAEEMTFEISITDPVKRAITGSYLQ